MALWYWGGCGMWREPPGLPRLGSSRRLAVWGVELAEADASPYAEQTDESVCGKRGRSRHVFWLKSFAVGLDSVEALVQTVARRHVDFPVLAGRNGIVSARRGF